LESSNIITKTINLEFDVVCEYDKMNLVMRLVKEYDLDILSQDLKLNCKFKISVRKKEFESIFKKFDTVFGFQVSSEHKPEEE
jgi:putative IMPACT (imprinted ancient) family translation regulator